MPPCTQYHQQCCRSSASSAGEKELASKLSVFIDSMAGVLFKDLDVAHCVATINEQS